VATHLDKSCVSALQLIVCDATAPAAARVAAARTLLEMSGRIGKHQPKPAAGSLRPGEMSLSEIDAELAASAGDTALDLF